MNDFMRIVPKYWYRVYQVIMMTFSAIVLIGSVALALDPSLRQYAQEFHYVAVASFAAVLVLYGLSFYWILRKRQEPLATLVCVFMFGMVALAGLDQASTALVYTPFLVGWFLAAFFNGMYGLPLLFGTTFLALVYSLAQVNFSLEHVDPQWWLLPLGSFVMATIGFFFWRRRYIGPQQEEINQLSDMLHSNQQQSLILLESLNDGVIVANRDGIITAVNSSATTIAGEAGKPVASGDPCVAIQLQFQDGKKVSQQDNPFVQALSSKKHTSGTYRVSNSAGTEKIVSLLVSPIITPKSNAFAGVIGVMRDISKEFALEQERVDFVNTASHEMRTPLATVEGYLSLVLNQKAESIPDKQVRAYLEHSYAAIRHLGQLFRDLLTTSQIERDELDNAPEVVNLKDVLGQITKEYATRSSVPITFNTDTTTTAAYRVYADAGRLRQVVGNLLDNAIKYTRKGAITVTLAGTADTVSVSIQDTGLGIAQSDMPKLFKKFSRLDNSETRTIGGTGLGLYVSRKIVEFYGGGIEVTSTPGVGSTFTFQLPTTTK